MSDISDKNIMFATRVHEIDMACREIDRAAHLFSELSLWDTTLERLDLRLSAARLRDAAAKVDSIANRLHGPVTAFPDFEALRIAAE